ncbi:MAG: hypothetical protein DRJ07_08460 [Bacteroidetes bacterium]|nr:MAG: hypothetical protein DRJ07_08460 [Bacteroidota bacterium]
MNTNSNRMKQLLFVLLLLIVFPGCKHFDYDNVFSNLEFKNFADSLPGLNTNKDELLNMLNEHEITMVHFFNGDCSSCIAGLKIRTQYIDSLFNGTIGMVFVANVEDTVLLNYYLLDRLMFIRPVLYDVHHCFYEWNKKSIDNGIETFLINSNGDILVMGDPIYNLDIEKKYF